MIPRRNVPVEVSCPVCHGERVVSVPSEHAARLTQAQFETAQTKIDDETMASRRDPERKAAFAKIQTEWEAAIALPTATFAQRETRLAEIARVANKHGLVR